MRLSIPFLSVLSFLTSSAAAAASTTTISVTPHDSYSSSIGVLGCKIDTNRVAYFPSAVSCDNLCIQLSYGTRPLKLLRIDQSGGAHDVSYDAWNWLYTEYSAREKPVMGGAVEMGYTELPAAECAGLLKTEGKKLPFSASNSMNFLSSCLAQEGSWVAHNYALYNIMDSACTWGVDERCPLGWPAANMAQCKSKVGDPVALKDEPVYNVQYGTGKLVKAGGQVSGEGPAKNAGAIISRFSIGVMVVVVIIACLESW